MDIYTLLVIGHIAGTVLGVGGATMVEIFLNKSLKDGHVDPIEGSFMHTTFTVVRWGLVISILSGFGFLLFYKFTGQTFKTYNPLLWAKLTIVLIIAGNALLLQVHKISLFWGSAISLFSWYGVTILGIFLTNVVQDFSYVSVMVGYVIVVVIGAYVLDFIRKHFFGVNV